MYNKTEEGKEGVGVGGWYVHGMSPVPGTLPFTGKHGGRVCRNAGARDEIDTDGAG